MITLRCVTLPSFGAAASTILGTPGFPPELSRPPPPRGERSRDKSGRNSPAGQAEHFPDVLQAHSPQHDDQNGKAGDAAEDEAHDRPAVPGTELMPGALDDGP